MTFSSSKLSFFSIHRDIEYCCQILSIFTTNFIIYYIKIFFVFATIGNSLVRGCQNIMLMFISLIKSLLHYDPNCGILEEHNLFNDNNFFIIINVVSQMGLTVLHKFKRYFQIYFEPTKCGQE